MATQSKEQYDSIFVLMGRVQNDIGVVGRDGWNAHHKYAFRSIDQLMNAVHAAFTKHGVFCVPEVMIHDKVERSVLMTIAYTFYGPNGDSIRAVIPAEGSDTQDKSTTKALSQAYKYAMMQVFSVPTEDIMDSDAEQGVDAAPQQARQEKRKQSVVAEESDGDDDDAAVFDAKRAEFLDVFSAAVHDVEGARQYFKDKYKESKGEDFSASVLTPSNIDSFIKKAKTVVTEFLIINGIEGSEVVK